MKRQRGRCRRCLRVLPLTVNGKLFLHGDQVPVYRKGNNSPAVGPHCAGGMTTDFDPVDAAALALPAREAST